MSNPRSLVVEALDAGTFAQYGRVLEPAPSEVPEVSVEGSFDFFVLSSTASSGWQIGYLRLSTVRLAELERHPGTPEVFAPLRGRCALVVSTDGRVCRAFALTRPVVLAAGVWHGVLWLAGEPEVLVAESNDVTDVFLPLEGCLVCQER